MSRESKFLQLFFEYFVINKRTPLKKLMMRIERDIIVKTLNKVEGNRIEATEILGIKNTTLHEKIKRYDIRLKREHI